MEDYVIPKELTLFQRLAKRSLQLTFVYVENFYHTDHEKSISKWSDRYAINVIEEIYEYETAPSGIEQTKEALDILSYLISYYGYIAIQLYNLSSTHKDSLDIRHPSLDLIFNNEFESSSEYLLFNKVDFSNVPNILMSTRRLYSSRKYHKKYVENTLKTYEALIDSQFQLAKLINSVYSLISNSVSPDTLDLIINKNYATIDLSKYQEVDSTEFGINRNLFIKNINDDLESGDAKFIKTWFI
jgi:hypothetical protein